MRHLGIEIEERKMSESATEKQLEIAKEMEKLARAKQGLTLSDYSIGVPSNYKTATQVLNADLFNQFLDNVYLCGGPMK